MKKIIVLFAVFLNLGCGIPEKKITEIRVKKVDLEITTITRVNCEIFDLTFQDYKELKTYVLKEKNIMDKVKNIIDSIRPSQKKYDIDVREKVIIFYSDNTKDTLCVSLTGLTLNGNLMQLNRKSLEFINKL
ncbi:hypothetical protein GKZ90_0025590 [Flavobacterium sp. MC2016-06]|jgi:hypothetical protein|uniref:hypothetical protein n=1 Tax=Flavobacterium sp. MC2016-06 TaxID=2676308 RepID=UPI0012BAF7A9|nr:hypothetical protein [Flavobacterium sp. MC2016-06]MBU3862513.1 hypothetical protein [Flavobacterium sp. MC2016-06]